ncbi:MAG: tRNA pseudouridine(38-40) synthase TruA [Megasphaera sp.]|jgi:tRNA pseudouridine38-40 synthase|nr:tRNA pseudouridine(38-40) synthase TruA [Megasphaera sp.]MCH4187225.1 tRNA pseudouridine(38-40) synthase TruA [Megasphaera sp.]MCH4217499.1 tRNA pseudouridine(38-40) synthase TruA [Megasphaera sp.]
MKKNICLTVAYDGTDFHGFQRQTNAVSVQAYLEQALSSIFHHPITIYGAARTDAGVHARGQVVNFYGEGTIPTEKIPYAMKGYLPPEIVVVSAQDMAERFSVRHDNTGKWYRYSIVNDLIHDPFLLRYAWFIRKALDHDAMQAGADLLLGTHDFSAFEGQNTTPMNPVKTMYAITIHRQGHVLHIDVIGDGFLYHMVRNIAGGLVDLGLHRLTPQRFSEILASRDRKQLGATAPARGLCLEEVFYNREKMEQQIQTIRSW